MPNTMSQYNKNATCSSYLCIIGSFRTDKLRLEKKKFILNFVWVELSHYLKIRNAWFNPRPQQVISSLNDASVVAELFICPK